jgi:hypothetical protein
MNTENAGDKSTHENPPAGIFEKNLRVKKHQWKNHLREIHGNQLGIL